MTETAEAVAEGSPEVEEAATLTNWEFADRIPTGEEVIGLLKSLPPVWGIDTVEFADYVQGLPSNKKVSRWVARDDGARVKVEDRHDVVTLYMSVSGRIKMIERAANENDWRVDFEPEPVTPTGVPGYLRFDDRIVYREYVTIWQMTVDGEQRLIGRKGGTAWVPSSGGSQAAGSNPYEKVETSARGRAIAAWGFGVLPGSGIASLEEMLGAGQNRAALQASAASGQPRKSREELIQDALGLMEALRQEQGIDEMEIRARTGKFLIETLGIPKAFDPGKAEIDWSVVKDGQVQLLVNSMTDALAKMRAGAFGGA